MGVGRSAGEFFEEFLLIQPILEGLTPVDEDYRDFVGELATQAVVGFDVNFTPPEAASALQFRKLLLHNFAKVASLAGIHNDLAKQ